MVSTGAENEVCGVLHVSPLKTLNVPAGFTSALLFAAKHINVSASRSQIEDADMAVEISEFTRVQIMAQSNQAALAQANATPQALLQLLK